MLINLLALILAALVWADSAAGAVIRDLDDLRQDPPFYLNPDTADGALLAPSVQAALNAEYDLLYFAPWHRTEPRHTKELAAWGFREYAGTPGYGKNGRPHPRDWLRKLAANAHLEDYPQNIYPAVTVNRTDFRIMPTSEPHSRYPRGPGKDNPFDNIQESSAPAGTPVLVTLISRDKKWLLAETSHLLGWVPVKDVAAVDQEFIKSWESGRYAVIIRDKTPVRDGRRFLFRAPLGAIFPITGDDDKGVRIWVAARDAKGKALMRKASVDRDAAAAKPLPFTPRHVALLAGELSGEPYGWGGLYGRRDCSALVRDIFGPFGLWFPRNSGEQAQSWRFTSLKNLPDAEKEALIVKQGVPWRTLLWTPGHIMLYIGAHKGKPLIFHNFWSVKTLDGNGRKGKMIVGRASVTSLHPGAELPNLDNVRADILAGLEGMTLVGDPPQSGTEKSEGKP